MDCEHDCRDGLVFTETKDGYVRVYACTCPLGGKYSTPMYAPRDREKMNPIYLPVYKKKEERVDYKAKQFKDD